MTPLMPEPSMAAKRILRGSKWSRVSNLGLLSSDLAYEAAEAEIRPAADLAVAHAHDVGQAVAAHVGELDGLGAIGEPGSPWEVGNGFAGSKVLDDARVLR